MNRVLLSSLISFLVVTAIAPVSTASQANIDIKGHTPSLQTQVEPPVFHPGDIGIPTRREGAGTR